MREYGALSQPHASVTCWAIHSAVGCAVTASHRMRLRSCRSTSNPYSSRNEIVGTTNRSIEAIPSAWFRRNVLQPCDGGRLCRAIYLATEVWPTSMPSLRSSPWMRGAPQKGFAELISRISCRTSRATLGLPGRRRDFQRQKMRNPARCHRTIVSGRTFVPASRTVGGSRYSSKDKPIERFEGRALGCAAKQYIQLVAKRYYLSFERAPRPEEVQKDPPEQIERLEHLAFIARFGRSDQVDGICDWDSRSRASVSDVASKDQRDGSRVTDQCKRSCPAVAPGTST